MTLLAVRFKPMCVLRMCEDRVTEAAGKGRGEDAEGRIINHDLHC